MLDAYSRRVIGWAVDRTMGAELALAALDQAIATGQPQPGLVHHSDQGSQHACTDYVERLEACGAVLSMNLRRRIASRLSSPIGRRTFLAPATCPSRCSSTTIRQ